MDGGVKWEANPLRIPINVAWQLSVPRFAILIDSAGSQWFNPTVSVDVFASSGFRPLSLPVLKDAQVH